MALCQGPRASTWPRAPAADCCKTEFGELILRNIIKIVSTRCQILMIKCTKFDFGWGSAPDPLAGFKGPTSKVRDGREGKGREVTGGEER